MKFKSTVLALGLLSTQAFATFYVTESDCKIQAIFSDDESQIIVQREGASPLLAYTSFEPMRKMTHCRISDGEDCRMYYMSFHLSRLPTYQVWPGDEVSGFNTANFVATFSGVEHRCTMRRVEGVPNDNGSDSQPHSRIVGSDNAGSIGHN